MEDNRGERRGTGEGQSRREEGEGGVEESLESVGKSRQSVKEL